MYDDLTNYPKPLTDTPEESFTLPNWMYTDPAVYELEKERIFYRTWQYVGHKTLFQKPLSSPSPPFMTKTFWSAICAVT